jgi:Heterokaryon incompatibility protein (HET)
MSSARQDFWTSVKRHRRFVLNQNQKTSFSYRGIHEKKARIRESLEAIPTTKYQYTNLPDPGNCIRILEVQAGHYDDVIVCKLKDITLSASVNHYEALSYVWTTPGEEVTLITIRVNDGSLEIGPSLHCALRFLRSSDRTRSLWVDAICIDQSSLLERDIQVPLMCEIYRNGTSTVCFLGPENRTTRTLFNMLEKLAEEGKTIDVVTLNAMDTLPAFVNHLPVHPVKTRLFDEYVGDSTIVDIVQRTWWHRAWTVQEIMLSSNAIMMIGKYTITWQNCKQQTHFLMLLPRFVLFSPCSIIEELFICFGSYEMKK